MEMKNILIVCTFTLLVAVLLSNQANAATYSMDVIEDGNPGGWTASLKTFDETFVLDSGQIFTVDIWMTNAPGEATAGGFWLDFTGSTDSVDYVSTQRYNNDDLPGPWQKEGVVVNEPAGAGTLMVIVPQLGGAQPDGDGDLIIARVIFEYLDAGNAHITIRTVPETETWGPNPPWDDDEIEPSTLIISPGSSPGSTTSILTDTTSSSTPSSSTTSSSTPSSSTTSSTVHPSTTSMHSTSSTTVPSLLPPVCVVEEIYGKDSEEVEVLRHFRDTILSKTQSGKEIIKFYYEWNPRVVNALKDDAKLKGNMRQMIDQILL